MRPPTSRAWSLPLSTKVHVRRVANTVPLSFNPFSVQSLILPHLAATTIECSINQNHVNEVHEQLERHGILKISLSFPDPDSRYLEQLVSSLNKHCGHQLPIAHSRSRAWFWDVRPENVAFQTANHRARSETMDEFPWHTDCSYEGFPPRYFALQVLQHDRFDGGTLSVMNIESLNQSLSQSTQRSLMRREYGIKIPKEFVKDSAKQQIVGNLMAIDPESKSCMMRFRRDLVTPLTKRASDALEELDTCLKRANATTRPGSQSIMHLTSAGLPMGSIIMMNNRRWLHSRNKINDPKRHLRRLRWDAASFPHVGRTIR
jgi:alpha-ketoglutarate-dependent taurine dioxygenase